MGRHESGRVNIFCPNIEIVSTETGTTHPSGLEKTHQGFSPRFFETSHVKCKHRTIWWIIWWSTALFKSVLSFFRYGEWEVPTMDKAYQMVQRNYSSSIFWVRLHVHSMGRCTTTLRSPKSLAQAKLPPIRLLPAWGSSVKTYYGLQNFENILWQLR